MEKNKKKYLKSRETHHVLEIQLNRKSEGKESILQHYQYQSALEAINYLSYHLMVWTLSRLNEHGNPIYHTIGLVKKMFIDIILNCNLFN